MRLTFDPAKDKVNQEKHGVSLAEAAKLEWSEMWCWIDDRQDYGEIRQVALAPIDDRLYAVVFADRPHGAPLERRIISLRKANRREVIEYAANS
jgi:uncharacterized DUF497 family protein